jgi:hypothetical protein
MSSISVPVQDGWGELGLLRGLTGNTIILVTDGRQAVFQIHRLENRIRVQGFSVNPDLKLGL